MAISLDQAVLDLGFGDGVFTAKLTNAIGVDSNSVAVKLAKSRGVNAFHCNAYRIATLGRFDAVTLFDTFEHLTRQRRMLDLLHDVAPVLYILNPDPNQSKWHHREFTADELAAFAADAGWRETHRERFAVTVNNSKTLMAFVSTRSETPSETP